MPLRDKPDAATFGRLGVEWGLRLLVVGVLAWYLAYLLRAPTDIIETTTSAALQGRLARWSTVTTPARVHVALDYPPPLEERDWLAALVKAGTTVTWSGDAFVATAVMVQPVADPAGGVDVAIAAPPRASIVLRDALGPFDTLVGGRHGIRVHLASTPSQIEAVTGPVVATARLQDSLKLGRLLVLGHAGWEAKFATAALEERGWKIDAVMAFSPKGQGNVHQGHVVAIDTSVYSAVLALDTVAGRYADQIARYTRAGGGLLLWASAVTGGLAALAPGTAEAELMNPGRAPADTAPRRALVVAPIGHLREDALVLEQQSGHAALVARRIDAGRVLATGYRNSWRWRLAGLDGVSRRAVDAHRDWLAHLVASVAYVGRHPLSAPPADAAPLATLVDQLGAATAPVQPSPDPRQLAGWVFGVCVAAAAIEWALRRLRGVK